MKLIDTIVWYQDSVSEFESSISLCMRFCRLNKVRPRDFFEFSILARALPNKSNWVPREVFSLINMPLLGKVLQAGQRLDHSGLDNFCYYPLRHASIRALFGGFRYCPVCIERGYHSLVHQVPWLARCLIHQEELLNCCPKCYAKIAIGKRDLLVRHRCPACGEQIWHASTLNPWEKAFTASEVVFIAEYVQWCRTWSKGRIYTTTEAYARSGTLDQYACIAETSRTLAKPENTSNAWRNATYVTHHVRRFEMSWRKAFRVFKALDYLGIDSILCFANANWANLYGIRRNLHQRIKAKIEERHRACILAINRAHQEAYGFYELSLHLDCLCFPCLLAKELAYADPHQDTGLCRPIEEHGAKYAREIEWLINNDLLIGTRCSNFSPNDQLRFTDRCSAVPFKWTLDEDLAKVLNHCNAIHYLSRARSLQKAYRDVRHRAGLHERAYEMADARHWSHSGGSFIFPSLVRGDLVVLSVLGHSSRHPGTSIFACSHEHWANVARRIAELDALIDEYGRRRREHHIALIAKHR